MDSEFLFGAEPVNGRDIFSRVVYGSRISLLIAFLATLLSAVLGTVAGVTAGYFGGWVDTLISRIMDVFLAFPILLFAIALAGVVPDQAFGLQGDTLRIVLIVFITASSTGPTSAGSCAARRWRCASASSSTRRAAWAPAPPRILPTEMLPNLFAPILVYTTLLIPTNILFEAALSFLGVGVRPPTPTWGGMISDATRWYQIDPCFMLWPGSGDLRDRARVQPVRRRPARRPRSPVALSSRKVEMRRTRRLTALALGAVATVALAACGGPSTTPAPAAAAAPGDGTGQAADANGVHNPSDAKGGTLRLANSGDWDSLDPADTYYAYSWNFVRLYGRSLTMFKSAPGEEGATLVPDLAENPRARRAPTRRPWTYTLRQGVKFEDGTPVTSKDVKYARRAVAGQDDVPQRPDLLQRLPRPAGLHEPVPGPEPGQAGPDRDRDPGRPDDRVQAGQAVQRVRLLRPAPVDDPGAAGEGHGHEVQGARGLHRARTCSRPTSWARASRWSATRTGTRPPTPTASRCPTGSRSRSTSTPTTSTTGCSPATSTSTSRARGVQAGRPGPDPGRPEPQGAHGQRPGRAALVHRDQRRRRPAGQHPLPQGGACTPPTAPATSAPTAAPPAATSPRTCMPPVIPGAQQFDLYPSAGNTGDLDKAKRRADTSAASPTASPPASPTAPSGPRRRPRPRRCSSRWPGSASSWRSSPTRRGTTSSSTPASPTSPRRTTSA